MAAPRHEADPPDHPGDTTFQIGGTGRALDRDPGGDAGLVDREDDVHVEGRRLSVRAAGEVPLVATPYCVEMTADRAANIDRTASILARALGRRGQTGPHRVERGARLDEGAPRSTRGPGPLEPTRGSPESGLSVGADRLIRGEGRTSQRRDLGAERSLLGHVLCVRARGQADDGDEQRSYAARSRNLPEQNDRARQTSLSMHMLLVRQPAMSLVPARFYAWLLAFFVATAPGVARAALMEHHDLASLALLSNAVVRAERIAIDPSTHVGAFRVTEVLRGDRALAGTQLDVWIGAYAFSQGYPSTPAFGADTFLFLERNDDGRSSQTGPYRLVSSGLRMELDGRAVRFEQSSNPGLFEHLPQRSDPGDESGPQLSMPELDAAIRTAIGRANRAIMAMTARDRRAAVLALCGPQRPIDVPEVERGDFAYVDAIADRLTQGLAATGDIEGALDVRSRAIGRRPEIREHGAELAAIAESTAAPTRLRVEALDALSDRFQEAPVRDRVIPLAAGGDPSVQAAALDFVAHIADVSRGDPGWPAERRALRAQSVRAIETAIASADERVRYAAIRAANAWRARPRASSRTALVVASHDGELAWAFTQLGGLPNTIPRAVVTATSTGEGGTPIECRNVRAQPTPLDATAAVVVLGDCTPHPGPYLVHIEIAGQRRDLDYSAR